MRILNIVKLWTCCTNVKFVGYIIILLRRRKNDVRSKGFQVLQVTLKSSLFSASCCPPRNMKGRIFVGPWLVKDIHGCDKDPSTFDFLVLSSVSEG